MENIYDFYYKSIVIRVPMNIINPLCNISKFIYNLPISKTYQIDASRKDEHEAFKIRNIIRKQVRIKTDKAEYCIECCYDTYFHLYYANVEYFSTENISFGNGSDKLLRIRLVGNFYPPLIAITISEKHQHKYKFILDAINDIAMGLQRRHSDFKLF